MIIKEEQEQLFATLNIVSFSEAVEKHKQEEKFETYLAAILSLANELDLEEKDIVKLLSKTLIDKIKMEAIEDGLMFKEESPMYSFL